MQIQFIYSKHILYFFKLARVLVGRIYIRPTSYQYMNNYIETQCSKLTSIIWNNNNNIKTSTILNVSSMHLCMLIDNTDELHYIRIFTRQSFSAKKACSVLGDIKQHLCFNASFVIEFHTHIATMYIKQIRRIN